MYLPGDARDAAAPLSISVPWLPQEPESANRNNV